MSITYVALCTNIPEAGDSSDILKEPPFSAGYVRSILEKEFAQFPKATGRWNNLLSIATVKDSKVIHVHIYDRPKHVYPGDRIKVHVYQEEN